MIKRAITTIILLQIFSVPKTVLCQHKIGSTNGIQFIFEEMKVYKTYEDYKNNNFVIAEFMDKNNFKKAKKKILEVKECWGYTIEYYSSEYIFRICDDSEYKTVLMSISGNLSLYCDGVPFCKPKTNENFILLNNFTLPMFFFSG
ncbi:MAG: hypothetical protein IPG01_04085 [Chitinophagaceae bacterium]|nr:hypothetical protein [Chitinophagaceae bacterium]